MGTIKHVVIGSPSNIAGKRYLEGIVELALDLEFVEVLNPLA
jgi:hypothetical protein